MSQIIFGGTVSMLTAATPSQGWIVGFDDDGILKQKDIFGIITSIGSGAGGGTAGLQEVLSLGNDSGVNSIIMGTSTFIKSNNGGGKIELDYGGVTNSILISTDNSTSNEHGLILQNGFVALFSNGYNQAIELENGNGDLAIYNINGGGSVLLGVATGSGVPYTEIDEIKISYNTTSTQSTGDYDKQSVFIGTRNSKISNGVVNTVVVGGQNFTASQSDSVYVPNIYLQNKKGIKSTDSNEVFYLNDINGYTLLDKNSGNLDSSWLLMANDYQSTYQSYVDFGVNSDPGYGSTSLIYIHNSKGPTYSYDDYSYISVGKDLLRIGSKDVDGTSDEVRINMSGFGNFITIDGSTYSFKGIEYGGDYSANFVTHSIVDKKYVDNQLSTMGVPNISSVLGSGNDTNTRSLIMGTSTNIRSGNPSSGGQINFDFSLQNSVLISTDNGSLSTSYILLDNSDVSIQSNELYIQGNNGQVEIGNNEGLKYTTQQNNFQNRSLVDKEYVDLGTASIWNELDVVAYSPTSSVTNYFPFYTSARHLSVTSSIYSSTSKIKGDINGTFSTGDSPKNIFYEPISKKMIVVNETSGDVNIIDSVSKFVIGTVSVGTQPHGIAFNPSTNDVFISNKGSNNISKFNLDTLIISATISVGSFPSGIQYLEDKVYVANQLSNNISVIDTTTDLISATISTSTPREFTWDTKNRRLWFIGVGPDYVGALNPDTNTIVNSVLVGSNPFNIEYDSNNDRIWVVNNGSGDVSVINTDTYLVVSTISVGTSPNAISYNPVNNYIYIANSSGQIIEVDTNTLSISNTITASSNVSGLSYNDYTSELYFAESSLDRVLSYQTVNTPGRYISIGKELSSSELDVEGTITTTGFRLRNGAIKDYVLTSDGSGKGTWQPRILEIIGGSGLTGSGSSGTVSIAVDFSVVASVNYVDTGTNSIWNAINSLGSGGLTPSNGLTEITPGNIGIGGTLSQNTIINGDSNEFKLSGTSLVEIGVTSGTIITLRNEDGIYDVSNVIYAQPGYGHNLSSQMDGGTYSSLIINESQIKSMTFDNTTFAQTYFEINAVPQAVGDGSTNNRLILSDNYSKGIVYNGDYTANFTTFSLVTKGWVSANTTNKYSTTISFTASITETITHNLGSDEIIVQCYDSGGTMIIPDSVTINGTNAVDIKMSQTLLTVKIVIIG